MKSVLFVLYSGMGSITSRIRGLIFEGPLTQAGWKVGYTEYDPRGEASLVTLCAQYDLVYLLKVPSIALVRELRSKTRARLIFDLTDALWMPHHRWNQWQDLEAILSEVDAVFSDNEFVADYGRKYNAHVHVIAACTQVEAFDSLRLGHVQQHGEMLNLGWVGTASTLSALSVIVGPLNSLFSKYPNLHLRILALNFQDPASLPNFTFSNFSVVRHYDEAQMIREVLNLDIGLFPPPCGLEDYAIRGPLKGLIYMTGGIACVCQRGGGLDRIIVDGENGMLADGPAEWEDKLTALIESPELRNSIGANALKTVRRSNSLEVIADKLSQAFDSVLKIDRAPAVTAQKKVLIVCSHYWPSSGGLESRMAQFSAELVREGYSTDVMTQSLPQRTSETLNGVRILSISGPEFTRAIRAAVESGNYDCCILIQDPLGSIIWSLEGLTPPPQTRLLIQPIINEDGFSRWKDHPTFRSGLTKILNAASVPLVMTRSGPDTRYMREDHIPAVYLPNATTPNQPAGEFRAKYGIAQDQFLVLHVANLYWVKNHVALIDALDDLPQNWQLVMVGNESGEPECVNAVRAKLGTRPEIIFIPGLTKEWVAAAMQAADVVVLASLGEGSPITILEAMSHGRPWLATPQCGAANDHLGGFICELDEFKMHLKALADSPEMRHRLGKISFDHWSQCYSWPIAMKGWIELIENGKLRQEFGPSAETSTQMDEIRKTMLAMPEMRRLGPERPKRWPLVSVIIPTYNRPEMLARSLASVMQQDYPNIEVLVVNDAGSPVNSVVEPFNSLNNFQIIVMPENGGAARARNAGLLAARGHYIAFLDDDDEFLKNHVSTLVNALRDRPERFAYSRAEYLIEVTNNNTVQVTRQQPFANVSYSRTLLEVGNFIPTPTWFIERSLVNEVGSFDESYKAWEDWEWLIRASLASSFISVPQITVDVHQRSDDASHLGVQHRPQMQHWFERVYEKHPASSSEVEHNRRAYLQSLFQKTDNATDAIATLSQFESQDIGQKSIVEIINRAEEQLGQGNWNEAAKTYQLWLQQSDSGMRFVAAYNLGSLWSTHNQLERAKQYFSLSLQLNPSFVQGHFALATHLERLGQVAEAAIEYTWLTDPANQVEHNHGDIFRAAYQKCSAFQTNPS